MRLSALAGLVLVLAACGQGSSDPASQDGSSGEVPSTSTGVELGSTSDASTTEGSSTGDPDDASSTGDAPSDEVTPWAWELPPGFPMPRVPATNPMTVEGVELGRHLFYDTRLSVDGTYACATCHDPAKAFTDGRGQAVGVTGQQHRRGAMSLANVAYAGTLAWANPELLDLEVHARIPLFGTEPVEMGLVDEADLVTRIEDEPRYVSLFAAAYPEDPDPVTLEHVTAALASFERSLISGRSPFDRWFYEGDEEAVSEAVKRGWDLFNFPGECTYCHFGFDFSAASYFEGMPERPLEFRNTALYDLDGQGAYPEGNEGLYRFTRDPADMGRFKPPTLRNIAVTAPYMHDGSVATLEEMLADYANGGRTSSPLADHRMRTFDLKDDDIADLVAFLESLTDPAFLSDPTHADPWAQ